eukprot:scaffold174489_cov36-Prasinocladus_malaysianus.AAC.2
MVENGRVPEFLLLAVDADESGELGVGEAAQHLESIAGHRSDSQPEGVAKYIRMLPVEVVGQYFPIPLCVIFLHHQNLQATRLGLVAQQKQAMPDVWPVVNLVGLGSNKSVSSTTAGSEAA